MRLNMGNIEALMPSKRWISRVALFCLLILLFGILPTSASDAETPIRVLVYGCDGAAKVDDIVASLEACNREKLIPGYRYEVTRGWFDLENKLDLEELEKHDVLIVPGGYLHKFPRFWIAEDIRRWVRGGGGYVGICGGEIVAIEGSAEGTFFGSFEGLQIAPHVYRINPRWVGERNVRMTDEGTLLLGLSGDQRMFHWNGSVLGYRVPPPFGERIFAIYAENEQDPEQPAYGEDLWNPAWDGAAAILGDQFGEGRLILSGPHPEFPSEEGKFQKPRLIGAMVKWAHRDDSELPFVVGREDKLPGELVTTRLSAMSTLVTAASRISSMSVFIRKGRGRGVLGIYSNRDGKPERLLTHSSPFSLAGKPGWYDVQLLSPITAAPGTRIWLAWMFDGPVALASDTKKNAGDLGGSRIVLSSDRWSMTASSVMPRIFPSGDSDLQEIVALYALGRMDYSSVSFPAK
jgi:glutamine amidotransferase-like uncharacterized protein